MTLPGSVGGTGTTAMFNVAQRRDLTGARRACAIDLAHAPGVNDGEDFIQPETRTGCESHRYFVGTRAFSSSAQFSTT
jgi:hypothetical protein